MMSMTHLGRLGHHRAGWMGLDCRKDLRGKVKENQNCRDEKLDQQAPLLPQWRKLSLWNSLSSLSLPLFLWSLLSPLFLAFRSLLRQVLFQGRLLRCWNSPRWSLPLTLSPWWTLLWIPSQELWFPAVRFLPERPGPRFLCWNLLRSRLPPPWAHSPPPRPNRCQMQSWRLFSSRYRMAGNLPRLTTAGEAESHCSPVSEESHSPAC